MKNFRFTIRLKITLLALSGIIFLAVVGGVSIQTIRTLSNSSVQAEKQNAVYLEMFTQVALARGGFRSQVQEWKDLLLRGNDSDLYAKYYDAFEKRQADVDARLVAVQKLAQDNGLTGLISTKEIAEMRKTHDELHAQYLAALKTFNPAHPTAGQEVDRLIRGLDRPFHESINGLADKITEASHKAAVELTKNAEESAALALNSSLIVLAIALPLLVLLGVVTARGILINLAAFQKTIGDINGGNFDARARADSNDELAELGHAFNDLLDSRVATLARIEKENEQLNDSVLRLLRAVAQLAQKDLTVRVPVSEDVTGAVSDALNLLSGETAKVLQDVANISADVTSASLNVQRQVDNMLRSSADQRNEVDLTAQSLASAAHSLNEIAELARVCNAAADNAIHSTQAALTTVNNTVAGINSSRDVIRETEKRIKRLGERSQEISGAVNLINVIAERTHILALNASMHAASAGEAGRGFAVVADEVQRLAENSRQATQQIAALVSNIQMETADTVSTMNDAIAQIVEGSRLAEQAGQQMQQTQQTTAELVASVKTIAANSEVQAKSGQELVERAVTMKQISEKTSEELNAQSSYTNNLVEYAKQLLSSVRVFKLPA